MLKKYSFIALLLLNTSFGYATETTEDKDHIIPSVLNISQLQRKLSNQLETEETNENLSDHFKDQLKQISKKYWDFHLPEQSIDRAINKLTSPQSVCDLLNNIAQLGYSIEMFLSLKIFKGYQGLEVDQVIKAANLASLTLLKNRHADDMSTCTLNLAQLYAPEEFQRRYDQAIAHAGFLLTNDLGKEKHNKIIKTYMSLPEDKMKELSNTLRKVISIFDSIDPKYKDIGELVETCSYLTPKQTEEAAQAIKTYEVPLLHHKSVVSQVHLYMRLTDDQIKEASNIINDLSNNNDSDNKNDDEKREINNKYNYFFYYISNIFPDHKLNSDQIRDRAQAINTYLLANEPDHKERAYAMMSFLPLEPEQIEGLSPFFSTENENSLAYLKQDVLGGNITYKITDKTPEQIKSAINMIHKYKNKIFSKDVTSTHNNFYLILPKFFVLDEKQITERLEVIETFFTPDMTFAQRNQIINACISIESKDIQERMPIIQQITERTNEKDFSGLVHCFIDLNTQQLQALVDSLPASKEEKKIWGTLLHSISNDHSMRDTLKELKPEHIKNRLQAIKASPLFKEECTHTSENLPMGLSLLSDEITARTTAIYKNKDVLPYDKEPDIIAHALTLPAERINAIADIIRKNKEYLRNKAFNTNNTKFYLTLTPEELEARITTIHDTIQSLSGYDSDINKKINLLKSFLIKN